MFISNLNLATRLIETSGNLTLLKGIAHRIEVSSKELFVKSMKRCLLGFYTFLFAFIFLTLFPSQPVEAIYHKR